MRRVLQAGDIADVAAGLATALEAHTEWRSTSVAVSKVRRRSKLARITDLPYRALRTRFAVSAAVAAERPEVVHLHWARYAPFVSTRGVPLLVHVHGSDVRDRRSSLAGRLVGRALSKSAAVLVSTPDLLAETAGAARYLPNPIDIDLFTPPAPPEPVLETERGAFRRPVVLLFARLNPIKGAERLVNAATAIRANDPAIRIVAVAGGALDDAAVAAGVEILPPMPRLGIARLLQSADVVVGQQLLGILSLSELEAMACARPVVVPLRCDLYGNDAPVVGASDADAIASRCLELVADPVRRTEVGKAARDFVVDRHSPRVVARALAEVYEEIV